jgi:ADP-ribose pyrophosphatase YjhB (NUDIX family)
MPKIIKGENAAKEGKLAVGCSAAIFDESGEKILLIRRTDDVRWAIPGGFMEPGEDLYEACAREVREETGLSILVDRLISVYTNPDLLFEYADGNRWQFVILHFRGIRTNGELTTSEESSACQFFNQIEAKQLNMSVLDHLRADDAFLNQEHTIINNRFDF